MQFAINAETGSDAVSSKGRTQMKEREMHQHVLKMMMRQQKDKNRDSGKNFESSSSSLRVGDSGLRSFKSGLKLLQKKS